jgi:hypothetical protein
MDVYILDALLRPVDVIDLFESIIWTERFAEFGDFELIVEATPANRKRFIADVLLSIPDSKRVMRIDSVEETFDADKGYILKLKGRELISITEQRLVAQISPISGELYPTYNLNGFPRALMEFFFFSVCVWGDQETEDILPFVQDQGTPSLYPPNTIPAPPDSITWSQKIDSLYNTMRAMSTSYDMGFRLYKDPNASKLHFEAYMGSDRTSAQTELTPIIFSEDMENLQNTNEFNDSMNHHNVVRVVYIYKDETDTEVTETVIVHDPKLESNPDGFDRKVKLVTITSIPETVDPEDIPEYLEQLGYEELNRSRPIGVFDGEIDQSSGLVYEQDYYLGDLVEVRGSNGATAYMKVVEQIIKEDANGKSSYPSLVSRTYINPGTWASWKYDVEWTAIGSEEYWANQ